MARNYEFRKELQEIHRPDIRDLSYVPGADEITIDDSWRIVIARDADRVIKTGALDLQDYLFTSLDVSVAVKRMELDQIPPKSIVVATFEQLGKTWGKEPIGASYTIDVAQSVIVTGFDARGCAQGCYKLEDRMNNICAPCLKWGSFYHAPEFSPRMIHSGYQMDVFPDCHLSSIAHAGMDAILMFVKDVNMTPTSHVDFNDLIHRAGKYGLDVYAYSYYESNVHPDDSGAEEHYESTYGKLFEECPGFKGIILVGESVEFPSKDPHVSPFKWYNNKVDGLPTGKVTAGWYPCCDYDKWLKMLQKVIYRSKPDADIVFWTYNWGHAPKDLRMKLIDSLPEGITLMATFEMDSFREVDGLRMEAADYTLSFVGPGAYFTSEAERAKERGIKLYTQANSGGVTWDFGVIPYEPFPMQWTKRWTALLDAKKTYGLSGIMESHHFGYWPSFISKIEKLMFTEPGMRDLDAIRTVTRELYGEALLPKAMEAMEKLSEAIHYYVCSNEDQYGPFRVGPSYPLVFHCDVQLPTVPYAHFGGNAICFTDYACDALFAITGNYSEIRTPMVHQRLPLEIKNLEKMRKLLQEGAAILESLTPTGHKAFDNLRLCNLVRFMANTVTTVIHVKEWNIRRWKLRVEQDNDVLTKLLSEMIDLGKAEIENAEATIPLVQFDSRLGWEPSMEYNCDERHLRWKIKQVNMVIEQELPKYLRGIVNAQKTLEEIL